MTPAWAEHECDVLVIGAGAAGLRAAIAAAEEGAHVVVACKSLLGKAGTVLETAFPEVHDGDAPEQGERLAELETWGALPLAGRGPRFGLEVLRTLQHRAVGAGVMVEMECSIQRLFAARGGVAGALGVRRADGAFMLFRCGAVVLAAGSGSRAWKRNSGSADETGDAFALALDAGAELSDMGRIHYERDGACRHGLGGVRVDATSAASRVPGLFAAGDAAASMHGARVLAGALASGYRAGIHASAHAQARSSRLISVAQIEKAAADLLRPLAVSGGESPYALLRELQDCMHDHVGPLRSVRGLEVALEKIAGLKARAAALATPGPRTWNPAWQLALEMRSLILAAEATARADLSQRGDVSVSTPGARLA
jgi:succinate dehydrogenase/fumarate reductase flavoprotein subunit